MPTFPQKEKKGVLDRDHPPFSRNNHIFLWGGQGENNDGERISFFQGCKIKMDDSGNILIKRISKSNVYVKSTELNAGQVRAGNV